MTRDKLEFRADLLDSESFDPARKQRFEREVTAMWERKLSRKKQIWFKVLAVLMLGLGIFFGVTAYLARSGFPPLARIAFVGGSFFCLVCLFLIWQIGRRGRLNLRVDPMRIAALSWGFVVIMVVVFMMLADSMPHVDHGVLMVVNGLVFLVGAGLILLRTIIEQSNLRTREQLLQIEFRLEQLSDELKKHHGGDDEFEPARI